jgi:hypothetical protein
MPAEGLRLYVGLGCSSGCLATKVDINSESPASSRLRKAHPTGIIHHYPLT